MNEPLQSKAHIIVCLLVILLISACGTTGVTINQPPAQVKFHAQIGTFVPPIALPPTPARVQVSIRDTSGNCVTTLALLSRLVDVIDHPDAVTNRVTMTQLLACSQEWVLPQPAGERIREYKQLS